MKTERSVVKNLNFTFFISDTGLNEGATSAVQEGCGPSRAMTAPVWLAPKSVSAGLVSGCP